MRKTYLPLSDEDKNYLKLIINGVCGGNRRKPFNEAREGTREYWLV